MRETVTISLPKSIKDDLDKIVKKEHLNRSDVVRDALRKYLALNTFQDLRGKMIPQAEQAGIFTDEDVFENVS
ncbi:MAG: CopG family transcriptional regulator [Candidatus Marinimicrobia bacterium]|jgi:metal-responsive CopG/Arc/MetJ family transcriptional regulator|nr:CopG family transcriptional regulator [Candidatus Neomarinimicrobiota bacterium]MBT4810127.1 CopG family transcriptional regulator [Candidatus Neomarinimicrobiota bacterium]MBT7973584.1 CopG family transcriptional regulator [Candidatus Neomarinimicrobiota bacterium]